MKKDEHKEIEMIIETGREPQPQDVESQPQETAAGEDIPQTTSQEPSRKAQDKSEKESESVRAFQRIRESASEDDDAPVGSRTLKQILGGDFLFEMVRHHIVLILFVVFFFVFYIGVRYQCEQDVLEINQLEKDLVDAKYKALSSSSNLTELCRQSNVLKALRESQDTLLHLSDQPPFIIDVPEE